MLMTAIPNRADLIAALNSSDAEDPLARRLSDALNAYSLALQRQTATGWPSTINLPAPTNEIEAFALELFVSTCTEQGLMVKIKGDS
jgi:hypothetical protein